MTPGTPSILAWSAQQQTDGYRSIETVYKVNTIKRGNRVHPLPMAEKQIDLTFDHEGKSWTVDAYMKAYNMSGVLILKDGVTVRQLLMMSSGVKWNEDYTDPKSDVAQSVSLVVEPGANPLVRYMSRLPRIHEPGSMFNYNTGETDLVGILVSNAVGMSLSDYASEKLWKSYGMGRDAIWMVDPAGRERGGCCISMTLRDYGRVGQFILDGGKAGAKPILPPTWTSEATGTQITNGIPSGYGYFWWMRPNGSYEAVGIFGQSITTFRDDRIIIVTNAAWPRATGRDLGATRTAFLNAARAAAKDN